MLYVYPSGRIVGIYASSSLLNFSAVFVSEYFVRIVSLASAISAETSFSRSSPPDIS